MRPSPVRALRRVMLALVLVSCTSDRLTGPQALQRANDVTLVPGALPMITEFMANPDAVNDDKGEWIEIYNPSTASIDLLNYKLASASGTTVIRPGVAATDTFTVRQSVVIPPGGYVVLGNNADQTTNGGVKVDYQYGAGTSNLSPNLGNNTTDWLTLKTPAGVLVDSVAYSPSTISATFSRTIGTPSYTPPAGTSRALIDLSADNTIASAANWSNSISTYGAGDRGTPGEANFGGEAVAVSVRATTFVTPGTTFRVTAGATDAVGKPSLTTFTWASSNPSIATIDPTSGVVTGVATGANGMAGIVTITATSANGISGSGTVFVVNPGDVASISISVNDPPRAPAGYTKPAFPTVNATNGALPAGTVTPLVWSSSDPAVATVSELGYITGVSAGTVSIRATAPNGVFGVVTFTVTPASAPTSAIYRNHVEFGAPVDVNSTGTFLLTKPQYVESYDPARGGPRWVSWNLNATQFGAAPRCDCFSADQTLPGDVYHVVDFDYRNGGYDRGHMVQSESRTTTDQENAATFLLTNILPQAAANNQGPWAKLEIELNDDVRTGGKEVYVVAGGVYRADAPTLKGENKVAIPDYTWKVAVILPAGKGLADVHSPADMQVIAVKIPNLTGADATSDNPAYAGTGTAATTTIHDEPWQTYATTVDQIETATGLDLLAALPDQIERLVESTDRPPVAAIGGPYAGLEGAAVTLDASASSDPDAGDVLTYAWDFGDGQTGTGATPSHVYADNGTYTATVTVSDGTGVEATATTTVTVSNVAPTAALVVPTSVNEGSPITLSLINALDPSSVDMTSLTFAFDCGDGTGFGAPTSSATASCPTTGDGSRTVGGRVVDKDGGATLYTASVSILNVAPVISDVTVPSAPASLGGTVSVSISATDAGGDPVTTSVDWGDGTSSSSAAGATFAATAMYAATAASAGATLTHVYAGAGVYTVVVTVSDNAGATMSTTALAPIVIYDPARTVSGNASITTPVGLYAYDRTAGGRAAFSASVSYARGAATPSGDMKFGLVDGRFIFVATDFKWLVVRDGRAQYTGQGTILGRSGTFRFLVTETDGAQLPGRPADGLRLKVWDASGNVVYDSSPSAPDISSAGTPIDAGNINIR